LGEERHPLQIFGRHNLMNLHGARLVCNRLGVGDPVFFQAIQSFKGASKRLEKVAETDERVIFRDFAHAPSKVGATVQAVRDQYPAKRLVACLELHTYSSLSKDFLGHYRGTLDGPDVSIVYYNPHALMIKRLPEIGEGRIRDGFGKEGLEVFSDSQQLVSRLMQESLPGTVLLMMSSGDYDGLDIGDFGQRWAGLK
jgi:UDP-N-acetylmuramate: L-alanyl-gamma-D-glutamyl-meso-diaminopimelate ligase